MGHFRFGANFRSIISGVSSCRISVLSVWVVQVWSLLPGLDKSEKVQVMKLDYMLELSILLQFGTSGDKDCSLDNQIAHKVHIHHNCFWTF